MSPNLQISGEGSDSNYAILLSILGTIPLLITVILCACWKRTRQKDELMGLPGIVIPKNPDENVHEIAAITVEQPILNGTVRVNVVIDDVDSYKRPTSMTKHRRSLPDIPNMPDLTIPCDPNGDNSSDLYATVHAPYNAGGSSMTDPQSSISQPDDPYSRVEASNKKTENPYAVVNENNKLTDLSISDSLGQNSTATILLQSTTSSCKSPNVHFPNTAQCSLINHAPNHPHAPPPLPLPSPTDSNGGRISNHNHDTLNHHPVVADDISAALAVRGDVAASQELPYMTPLINNGVAREPQVNFSGDSQDSSKGYTSITVRAPIKDIKASDAADSDDSDGMYQKIPDGNNQSTYTSGSETYEQIQPQITVAVEINNPQLQEQADFDYNNEINAGSSSSSVQNLGSPKPEKPEKRPTNSPLPPTPSSVASTSNLDKPIQNLNDIYAKVNKKPKRDDSKNKSASIKSPNPLLEQQARDTKFGRKIEHNYETIKSSPKKSQQQNSLDSDPGYEKLQPRNANAEPGYESVHSDSAALELIDSDPNYEQLRPKSPATSTSINHNHNSAASSITSNQQQQLTVDGYSVIRHGRQSNQSSVSSDILTTTRNTNSLDEPNYESMPNSENSDISCDLNEKKDVELSADYKRLNSDEDSIKTRGLKRVKANRSSNTSGLVDLNLSNATSNNSSNSSDDLDPNYESLRDHLDTSANSGDSTKCEEPNYESVKYEDAVNSVNVGDDKSLVILSRNDSFRLVKQEVEGYDDGYEKIRKKHVDGQQKLAKKAKNPDYETIGNAADEDGNTGGGGGSSKSNFKDDFFEV